MKTTRENIIHTLCDNLSDAELAHLVLSIKQKMEGGMSTEDVGLQLFNALTQTIYLAHPELSNLEIIDIAEEVGDKLLDRLISFTGSDDDDGATDLVPPKEFLN